MDASSRLMRRGEFWEIAADADSDRTLRVLIVSTQSWHTGADPMCIGVVRGPEVPEVLPYLIRLATGDPVPGVLVMESLCPVDASAFVGLALGVATEATMAKVTSCLREMLQV